MRRKSQKNETEIMRQALDEVEDPYQIRVLATVPIEELAQKIERQMRYTAASMVQCGCFLYAIKERLDHGEWEPFVQARQWSWNYVRGCMKLVDVVAKYPQALHLPPGRVTNQLLHLPMSKIDEVMEALPEATIKKLTPWQLTEIYEDKKREGRPVVEKEYAPLPPPSHLTTLVNAVTSALNLLAEYEISKADYVLARRYANEVALRWDAAIYNLSDPAHKGPPPWDLSNSDDISDDPQEDED